MEIGVSDNHVGTTYFITISPTDTAGDIKNRVALEGELDDQYFDLVSEGRVLQNQDSDYDIQSLEVELSDKGVAVLELRRLGFKKSEISPSTLHDSILNDNLHLTTQLLSAGVDANAVCFDETALFAAVLRDRFDQCRVLLHHGALPDPITQTNRIPLHWATGNLKLVQLLIEFGVDLNRRTASNETALHAAAVHHDRLACAEVLIDYGIDVNTKSKCGITAIHKAAKSGNYLMCELLAKRQADVNCQTETGVTALHYAAESGQLQTCRSLLDNGADANSTRCDEVTPLQWAAENGFSDVCDILLQYNADVNILRADGTTSLHWAALKGHLDVCKVLTATNTDIIQTRTDNGMSPLHWAASNKHHEICDLLLNKGASPQVQRDDGLTPLHWSAKSGCTETTNLLIKSGAVVNAVTKTSNCYFYCGGAMIPGAKHHSETPLHYAASRGYLNVCQMLIDCGADINIKTEIGDTASDYAEQNGYHDLAKQLKVPEVHVDPLSDIICCE